MDRNLLEHGLVHALNDLVMYDQMMTADAAKELGKKHKDTMIEEVEVEDYFEQFYNCISSQKAIKNALDDSPYTIYAKTLTGRKIELTVNALTTIETLKARIKDNMGIPHDQQRLIFLGMLLQDGTILAEYGIRDQSTLHLVLRLSGGGFLGYIVNLGYFDPQWDFDFRKVKKDNYVYYRNKFIYKRPLGSMRYAIKVIGKYSDDDWLGKGGERTGTNWKEWPVAYHGTLQINAMGIVKNGFSLAKGVRQLYGKGIYCTPNPKAALDYAVEYKYKGKTYRLILQTRVDPKLLKVVQTIEDDANHGEYWLLPNSEAIRPYGVCVYEM